MGRVLPWDGFYPSLTSTCTFPAQDCPSNDPMSLLCVMTSRWLKEFEDKGIRVGLISDTHLCNDLINTFHLVKPDLGVRNSSAYSMQSCSIHKIMCCHLTVF